MGFNRRIQVVVGPTTEMGRMMKSKSFEGKMKSSRLDTVSPWSVAENHPSKYLASSEESEPRASHGLSVEAGLQMS